MTHILTFSREDGTFGEHRLLGQTPDVERRPFANVAEVQTEEQRLKEVIRLNAQDLEAQAQLRAMQIRATLEHADPAIKAEAADAVARLTQAMLARNAARELLRTETTRLTGKRTEITTQLNDENQATRSAGLTLATAQIREASAKIAEMADNTHAESLVVTRNELINQYLEHIRLIQEVATTPNLTGEERARLIKPYANETAADAGSRERLGRGYLLAEGAAADGPNSYTFRTDLGGGTILEVKYTLAAGEWQFQMTAPAGLPAPLNVFNTVTNVKDLAVFPFDPQAPFNAEPWLSAKADDALSKMRDVFVYLKSGVAIQPPYTAGLRFVIEKANEGDATRGEQELKALADGFEARRGALVTAIATYKSAPSQETLNAMRTAYQASVQSSYQALHEAASVQASRDFPSSMLRPIATETTHQIELLRGLYARAIDNTSGPFPPPRPSESLPKDPDRIEPSLPASFLKDVNDVFTAETLTPGSTAAVLEGKEAKLSAAYGTVSKSQKLDAVFYMRRRALKLGYYVDVPINKNDIRLTKLSSDPNLTSSLLGRLSGLFEDLSSSPDKVRVSKEQLVIILNGLPLGSRFNGYEVAKKIADTYGYSLRGPTINEAVLRRHSMAPRDEPPPSRPPRDGPRPRVPPRDERPIMPPREGPPPGFPPEGPLSRPPDEVAPPRLPPRDEPPRDGPRSSVPPRDERPIMPPREGPPPGFPPERPPSQPPRDAEVQQQNSSALREVLNMLWDFAVEARVLPVGAPNGPYLTNLRARIEAATKQVATTPGDLQAQAYLEELTERLSRVSAPTFSSTAPETAETTANRLQALVKRLGEMIPNSQVRLVRGSLGGQPKTFLVVDLTAVEPENVRNQWKAALAGTGGQSGMLGVEAAPTATFESGFTRSTTIPVFDVAAINFGNMATFLGLPAVTLGPLSAGTILPGTNSSGVVNPVPFNPAPVSSVPIKPIVAGGPKIASGAGSMGGTAQS